ncbi:hypothetical protein B7463_g7010, partial [Scytalidium lignicola]
MSSQIVSKVIFGAQGIFLLGNAFYSLVNPSAIASMPGGALQGAPIDTIKVIGLSSFTLGVFYVAASYQGNIAMMVTSIPGRIIANYVLYREGGPWRNVAIFEACMGLVTAVGVGWDIYWSKDRFGLISGKKIN